MRGRQSYRSDPFEELREAFHARLRHDRVRFTAFGAALARADEGPAPIFEEIGTLAHRLAGAALIFEDRDIGMAASALEEAADAAVKARVDNSDPFVWAALETLVDRLALMNGKGVPAVSGPTDRTHMEPKPNGA
jgi:hypothetical protein